MLSSIHIRSRALPTGLRRLTAFRWLLAASILGAFLGEQSILCIEADGQSHFEISTETCCSLGEESEPGGSVPGAELLAGTACQDCRDFPLTNIVQGRPADRGSAPRPTATTAVSLAAPSLPPVASSCAMTGQDPQISPVLLTLRTIVLSC
jgi:hypothetical protein